MVEGQPEKGCQTRRGGREHVVLTQSLTSGDPPGPPSTGWGRVKAKPERQTGTDRARAAARSPHPGLFLAPADPASRRGGLVAPPPAPEDLAQPGVLSCRALHPCPAETGQRRGPLCVPPPAVTRFPRGPREARPPCSPLRPPRPEPDTRTSPSRAVRQGRPQRRPRIVVSRGGDTEAWHSLPPPPPQPGTPASRSEVSVAPAGVWVSLGAGTEGLASHGVGGEGERRVERWLARRTGGGGGGEPGTDPQAEEGPGAWEPEIAFRRGLGMGGLVPEALGQLEGAARPHPGGLTTPPGRAGSPPGRSQELRRKFWTQDPATFPSKL
ncbi:translation initiation factor IF-2-like [Acinonyx jubatus]|uniref:Translation initiation factor IF-2-like n=1 Tax=Acinonyx jubatus TaxID=32536 RepID=A0ABM3PX78_ACIJB|nr:translation initiation factor IF-2-like [Acinonyx jubatus]